MDIQTPYIQEGQCAHDTVVPTKYRKSNGVVCVYLQCADCGENVREARKADYDVATLPWFDEAFRERQREHRWTQRQQAYQQERERRDAAWWMRYTQYLRSSHWQNLRRAVLERDGYRCQNCFRHVTDMDAHIHHQSYVGFNRVGYSFAFECVTLCPRCHEEYHGNEGDPDLQRRRP